MTEREKRRKRGEDSERERGRERERERERDSYERAPDHIRGLLCFRGVVDWTGVSFG